MNGPGAGNKVTVINSNGLTVSGNFDLAGGTAGIAGWTSQNGNITFNQASGTATINFGGLSSGYAGTGGSSLTFNGASTTFLITNNITHSGSFILSAGTLDAVTNSKTITLTGQGIAYNFTMSGTANFYSLLIIPSTPSKSNIINFQGTGTVSVSNTLTINGGTTLTDRIGITHSSVGNGLVDIKTINCTGATTNFTNVDIENIAITGSPTQATTVSVGDCGGNSGITFTTPATQTYTNVNGGNWSTAGDWTSRAPLPQDDVIINTAFGASKTLTVDMPRLGKSIDFSGATWTTGFTFNIQAAPLAPSIYGSLTLKSGMTLTAGSSPIHLRGKSTYFITRDGVTIDSPVTITSYTGTYKLADNFTLSGTRIFTLNGGTFDINGQSFNVGIYQSGQAGYTATITDSLGGGSFNIPSSGTTVFVTANTASTYITTGCPTVNLTYSGGTGTRTINNSITSNYDTALHNYAITAGTDTISFQAASRPVGSIDFTGFAGTISNQATPFYGNLIIPAGVTITAGANKWTLSALSGSKTLSIAPTCDLPITINATGVTYTLGANLTMGATRALTLTAGTLNCNNYAVSTGSISVAGDQTLSLGSATHLLTGTGTVWSTGTRSKINADAGTLKITDTSNAAITFGGGVVNTTLNNVWFSRGASTGNITINGSNNFNDFKDDGTAAHSLLFQTGQTNRFESFTVSGTAGNLITLNVSSGTSTYTFVKTGGTTPYFSRDYLNIQHCIATPNTGWYAGANSVNNQGTATAGSGWVFTAPPGPKTVSGISTLSGASTITL